MYDSQLITPLPALLLAKVTLFPKKKYYQSHKEAISVYVEANKEHMSKYQQQYKAMLFFPPTTTRVRSSTSATGAHSVKSGRASNCDVHLIN